MGSCFHSLKIQLILYGHRESRWSGAVILARSRWLDADGWRGRGRRASLLLWPLGGISWGLLGGVLHAGQTKGPSDREINFWRWPKVGAQKYESKMGSQRSLRSSRRTSPLLLCRVSLSGCPRQSPGKAPQGRIRHRSNSFT